MIHKIDTYAYIQLTYNYVYIPIIRPFRKLIKHLKSKMYVK